jgi:hypothetical protein
MHNRRPFEVFRPGLVPDLCYGFGRDYSMPMMSRQAFARCEESLLASRATSPCRLDPLGFAGSRRPPC